MSETTIQETAVERKRRKDRERQAAKRAEAKKAKAAKAARKAVGEDGRVKYTPEQVAQIQKRRAAGERFNEISDALGINDGDGPLRGRRIMQLFNRLARQGK